MELWQSSTGEDGSLYLAYRCSCGYQDTSINTYKEPDEYKEPEEERPKVKQKPVEKWD